LGAVAVVLPTHTESRKSEGGGRAGFTRVMHISLLYFTTHKLNIKYILGGGGGGRCGECGGMVAVMDYVIVVRVKRHSPNPQRTPNHTILVWTGDISCIQFAPVRILTKIRAIYSKF